ncbi:MAG: hypothetical protein KF746_10645 [Chitinophagaceae bacterium]|nr:hypothetical protein [Chitinophagaceae bacterium]
MEKWLLKIVHIFDGVFRRQGIDISQLYAIVETKMTLDKRRVYMNWRQSDQSDNKNHLLMVLAVYGFFSVFMGAMIFFLPSFILAMIFLHAYIIFMMAMTLITDFSTVLLDTTDNQIILPKPVNSRTLFMARQVHILLYLFQFTIAMCLIPVVCVGLKYGILTGLAAAITTLLSVLLAVFFTYFLYLLVLRFSSEARAKEAVTWFQIAMTVFFAVGYQIIPRMINMSEFADRFELHWYSYLLPPVWMAVALESVYTLQADFTHLLVIILAVSLPLLLFWILNKYLAPSFTARLSAINTEARDVSKKNQGVVRKSLITRLSSWFTRTNLSKAGFEMVWNITGRDKSFKLQFYPSLGYVFVFIFIFVFNSGRNVGASWNELSSTTKFLWFIYLPMFTVANALLFITYNENFAASWIYRSAPVKKPGELLLGGLIALFIKYFLFIYMAMLAISLYIWGWKILDDFLFGLANDYLCFLILGSIGKQYLPFSRQPNTRQQTGRFLLAILQMMIVAALVGMHYLVIKVPAALYVLLPVVLAACWLLQQNLRNLPWKKIAV